MYRDFESRKTLYYGVDDKKVYDYQTLISDIEGGNKANGQGENKEETPKDTSSSSSPVKKAEPPVKPAPKPTKNESKCWFM